MEQVINEVPMLNIRNDTAYIASYSLYPILEALPLLNKDILGRDRENETNLHLINILFR